MIRVELFVLIGLAIGIPLGVWLSWLVRTFLSARDKKIESKLKKIRVNEVLDSTDTVELLNELSQRDLTDTKRNK
jgi:hypothetical protein